MKLRLGLGLLALAMVCVPARAVEKDEVDRAIAKGVKALRALQRGNGTWPHFQIGATALAGLTLLECGAAKDDKAVLAAANAVRKASLAQSQTYSISLSLLFLDRLGDRDDVPFIEALASQLLAGQEAASGGWSYGCPMISAEERSRLQQKLNSRKDVAIDTPVRPAQPDPAGIPQFPNIPAPAFMPVGGRSDNSNTQFGALGLWVARRHGVRVEGALTRLGKRFRTTQMDDGGWTYMPSLQMPGASMPAQAFALAGLGSSAAMTCAGLLGLAIVDGATLDEARKRKPDAKLPDISADKHLSKGLQALGAVIGDPRGVRPVRPPEAAFAPPGMPMPAMERVGGRTYYFLWSLERVAVALDLKTIGNKDWYNWGAEILLENQLPDGTWSGEYSTGGVDTCFALLFLRRANLVGDLTASLKGKIGDPGERVLRGGLNKAQRGGKRMMSGIEGKGQTPGEKSLLKAVSAEGSRLAQALLKAKGARRAELLETMENEKGVKYTEALAAVIPRLEGEDHRKARQALANRLTRMKDESLQDYLHDEDAEIRRAAALAVGQKDSKALVPALIAVLRDPELSVVRAAHASLKELTEQDFGPAATATREERDRAALKWIAWWGKRNKK